MVSRGLLYFVSVSTFELWNHFRFVGRIFFMVSENSYGIFEVT